VHLIIETKGIGLFGKSQLSAAIDTRQEESITAGVGDLGDIGGEIGRSQGSPELIDDFRSRDQLEVFFLEGLEGILPGLVIETEAHDFLVLPGVGQGDRRCIPPIRNRIGVDAENIRVPVFLRYARGLGDIHDEDFLLPLHMVGDGQSYGTADGAREEIGLLAQQQIFGLPQAHLGVELIVAGDHL
jgi:hypothetical protein